MKIEFTIEHAANGFILRINKDNYSGTFVFTDEIEMLELLKEYLDLGDPSSILIERRGAQGNVKRDSFIGYQGSTQGGC